MEPIHKQIRILLHDLRTPLATIQLIAELLQTDPHVPSEMRHSLEQIITEVGTMARLTDELGAHPATQVPH